ncbi:MAG: TSUP family transporter [Actinomycetota bacterium]
MPSAFVAIGIGLFAGLGSGLLGVGGGTVMVPLSVLWLGLTQHKAHATSLAAIAPIALVGAIAFAFADEIDVPAALGLGAGALIGAPLGAKIMAGLSASNLKVAFGVFLVAVGAAMVL